jgi:phage-related protein
MAGTLRNLLVRVGADVSGLSQGLKNAQKQVQFFGRNVTGSMKEIKGQIAGAAAALGGGMLIKSGVQDAMRYEALMATLGESMGESRKEFEKWQETAGNAFGYSRLQSAETANLLSLNFKQIADSQEDLVKKTTKMMEMAAVVANKRGMTMQEVSDRIRSAMNQEADGADELGVNVRIAAVKQSQAYQEMANGQPWDQLTENMRKTILYHHILQQVSERLGSTMQDTTALRMAQFTASLADVRMALGQAFLPIMYQVLPYLNAMAQALYKVLTVIAAFTRSLFGGGFVYKAPKGFADVAKKDAAAVGAIGDASEDTAKKSSKAAKKAQKAWKGLFGFDEVHTIKDPEESAGAGGAGGGGGGGGAGGLGATDLMPESPFKPFEEQISELAKKMDRLTAPIKAVFKSVWEAVSTFAIEKFNQIRAWWAENGAQITQAFKNVWDVMKPIIMAVVGYVWESIKGLISGIITFFQGLTEFFTGVFTGDWKMAWEGLKKIFFGAFQAVWNFLNLTVLGGIRKALANLVVFGVKLLKGFADDFVKFFANAWTNIGKIFKDLGTNFKKMIDDIVDWWIEFFIKISLRWATFKRDVLKVAGEAWEGIKGVFKGAADWFGRNIITPIVNRFQEIKDAFKEGLTQGLKAVLNAVRRPINEMIDSLNAVKNKIPIAKNLPNIPKIPALAQGGITSGPTLAMVGDNVGGREVISPLDRLQSMLTNSVIQAMQLAGGAGNNQNTGDIILNIDGRAFARLVKPFLDKEQNRVGSDVRIRTI